MADHSILIPFILNAETSVAMDRAPEKMYAAAARKGPSATRHDKGGLTLCGITRATFSAYCRRQGLPAAVPLSSLTYAQWLDIYKTMFWDRCAADLILSDKVAAAIVDWTWVSGANAIRHTQRLLGVAADSIAGPITIRAINAFPDQEALFGMIQRRRISYHAAIAPEGSTNRVFLGGWNNRVNRLSAYLMSNIKQPL